MTANAREIMNLLESTDEHLTAEEIFFRIHQVRPKMVLATVYNNLNSLMAEGKVMRVSTQTKPDRYERNFKHDHLLCKMCGKLTNVNLSDLTADLKAQVGGDMLSYDLRIGYICEDCKRKL